MTTVSVTICLLVAVIFINNLHSINFIMGLELVMLVVVVMMELVGCFM